MEIRNPQHNLEKLSVMKQYIIIPFLVEETNSLLALTDQLL